MTHDEMIAVILAHKAGKKIESRAIGKNEWYCLADPVWDFAHYDYRVKREPRDFWLHSSGWTAQKPLDIHTTIHVREVLE